MGNITNWTRFSKNGLASLGSDFTLSNTYTFEYTKFCSGFNLSLASNGQCAHSSYLDIFNNTAWTIEFDVLYKYSVTNGVYNDGNNDTGIIEAGDVPTSQDFLWLLHRTGGMWIYLEGGGVARINQFLTTQLGSWSAGTLKKYRFIYCPAGIDGGSNTFRVYLDGSLVWSTNASIPWNIETGGGLFNLGWEHNGLPRQFQSPISNFKSWDYANVYTANSQSNEGFGGAKKKRGKRG